MAKATARGVLDVDIKRWQAGFMRAGQSIKAIEKQALRVGRMTLFAGGAGIAVVTKLLSDFQREMAKVGALTGATGKDFEKLEANARQLGATTKFSATKAADGMAFLAQAGFDANEILASSKDFLNLAAAGSTELAQAMDIASNVMQGFQLEAEESGRVADVLALSANRTNTNVLQLGEAMKNIAPIAAALGISIEDASAAIGALGNAGIQGSDAGTALRSILLRLAKPTSEVKNGIKALNLTIEELNPVTNSITQVFGRLSVAMANAESETIAVGAANDIFGKRAAAAGLVLRDSVVALEDLSRANKRAEGSSKKLADEMSAGLNGALKRLQSQIQDVALEIGEGGLGEGIEDAVKKATDALSEFVGSGDAANFGALLRDQIDTALEAAKMLADGFAELRRIASENRDTIEGLGKAILVTYAAFKAFQLASFIASIVQTTVSFASQTIALGANTAALGLNTKAAAANAAAQTAMAGAATRGAAAQAGASAAAGSKVGGLFVGGYGKALARIGGVTAAAFAGIEIGKFLDNKFNLSDIGSDIINTFTGVNREMRKMEEAQFDVVELRAKRLEKEKNIREDIAEVSARHFKTEDTGAGFAKKRAELAKKRLEIAERLQREDEARLALAREIAQANNIGLERAKGLAADLVRIEEKRADATGKTLENMEAARKAAAEQLERLRAQAGEGEVSAKKIMEEQRLAKLAREIAATQGLAAKDALQQARERIRLEDTAKRIAQDRARLEDMMLDAQRDAMGLARDRAREISGTMRQLIADAQRLGSSVPQRGSGASSRERSIARQQGSEEISRLREEAGEVRRALRRLGNSGNATALEITKLEKELRNLLRGIANAEEDVKGQRGPRGTRGTPLQGNRPSITGLPTNPNSRLSGGSGLDVQRANQEAAIAQKEAAQLAQATAQAEASMNQQAANNITEFANSIQGFSDATTALKNAADTLRGGGERGLKDVADEILKALKDLTDNPL